MDEARMRENEIERAMERPREEEREPLEDLNVRQERPEDVVLKWLRVFIFRMDKRCWRLGF